jgi:hypothetical protein
VGTDGGVYVSLDGGLKWDRLGTNLPYMPVYDIDYNPVTKKIIAASFSRGILTFPVEELEVTTSTQHEFEGPEDDWATVYPTIVTNQIKLELIDELSSSDKIMLTLIDSGGKVWSQVNLDALDEQFVEIGSDMPQGLYIVRIESGLKSYSQKIIIQ